MSQASSFDPAIPQPEAPSAPPLRRQGVVTPIVLTLLCAGTLYLTKYITDSPNGMMVMFMGPVVCALLFLIWWLFFSRRSWTEKLAGLGGVLAVVALSILFSDKSMQMALMMNLPVYLLVCWTLALIAFSGMPSVRPIAVPLALLPAALLCMAMRLDGITGGFDAQFSWRWNPRPEEPRGAAKTAMGVKPLELTAGDWPAFRGPNRDSILHGVKIRTDWSKTPPKELWRSKIGPGWSSVAVVGDHVFTQEQRQPGEAVVCLSIEDGREIWSHVDETRFDETIGGPGPRATPTFANGRLFTVGANGLLNAFDAATGEKLWSHDLAKENEEGLKKAIPTEGRADNGKSPVPMWGFSGSPLVIGDKVVVYVGAEEKGIAVFNAADGKPVWAAGTGGHSYTSPHLATLAGVAMILNTTNKGIEGLDVASGKQLWNHERKLGQVVPCVQPSLHSGDRVAIGTAFGTGTSVVAVAKSGDGFAANALDTIKTFKPYFSDYVTIGDIAYGFDGAYFGCFDLQSGKKLWNAGRRYGSGQVLLLADQNLLLVISELDGNVVLVPADKSVHKEVGKFKALTGKTWNHPVVAHGRLIVRNGEEIACYDVSEK